MGTLTLVRHGQATAFEADSDRLTELGERQATRLGEYLGTRGAQFDSLFTGTLTRQRHSAALLGEAARAAGASLPASTELAQLNEYDGTGIAAVLAPRLAQTDQRFRRLFEEAASHAASAERNRYFQRMFEFAAQRWLEGSLGAPEVETWRAFHARVRAALALVITGEASGRRVLVVTSGGVIGAIVQIALAAPEPVAIELNWRIRNSSVTQLLFTGSRLSLDAFNTLPHLDDPGLHSFR